MNNIIPSVIVDTTWQVIYDPVESIIASELGSFESQQASSIDAQANAHIAGIALSSPPPTMPPILGTVTPADPAAAPANQPVGVAMSGPTSISSTTTTAYGLIAQSSSASTIATMHESKTPNGATGTSVSNPSNTLSTSVPNITATPPPLLVVSSACWPSCFLLQAYGSCGDGEDGELHHLPGSWLQVFFPSLGWCLFKVASSALTRARTRIRPLRMSGPSRKRHRHMQRGEPLTKSRRAGCQGNKSGTKKA